MQVELMIDVCMLLIVLFFIMQRMVESHKPTASKDYSSVCG